MARAVVPFTVNQW